MKIPDGYEMVLKGKIKGGDLVWWPKGDRFRPASNADVGMEIKMFISVVRHKP